MMNSLIGRVRDTTQLMPVLLTVLSGVYTQRSARYAWT